MQSDQEYFIRQSTSEDAELARVFTFAIGPSNTLYFTLCKKGEGDEVIPLAIGSFAQPKRIREVTSIYIHAIETLSDDRRGYASQLIHKVIERFHIDLIEGEYTAEAYSFWYSLGACIPNTKLPIKKLYVEDNPQEPFELHTEDFKRYLKTAGLSLDIRRTMNDLEQGTVSINPPTVLQMALIDIVNPNMGYTICNRVLKRIVSDFSANFPYTGKAYFSVEVPVKTDLLGLSEEAIVMSKSKLDRRILPRFTYIGKCYTKYNVDYGPLVHCPALDLSELLIYMSCRANDKNLSILLKELSQNQLVAAIFDYDFVETIPVKDGIFRFE